MVRTIILIAALVIPPAMHAQENSTTDKNSTARPRYTFSWPLDDSQLQPRGGTTRGAPVTLDDNNIAWQALHESGLSAFERDRRAILAMAGTYRVSFDFIEVVAYAAQSKLQAPYQSWGTEKIYIDTDDGKFISLLHILEMRVVDNDGKISEPFVVKHWRQDWRYEPASIVEYVGNDRWVRRSFAPVRNAWAQTVYQVDEPRYASIGSWKHSAAYSTWLSGDTSRPLPRREWSVRNDYQILRGTNRHTIVTNGWVQEENNLKAVLNAQRQPDPLQPVLAREYGVARYERIRDDGFTEADSYFANTRAFWNEVRDTWSVVFQKHPSVTLRGPVDKLGLFAPLFAQADRLAEQPEAPTTKNAEVIRSALDNMRVPK